MEFREKMKFSTREMPADFADHAYEPVQALKRRYSTSHLYIQHWRGLLGIDRKMVLARMSEEGRTPNPKTQMPADFVEVQRGKTRDELVAHYGYSKHIIQRFCAAIGDARETARDAKARPNISKTRKPMVSTFTQTGPVDRAYKEDSRAAEAARYLQPDYVGTYRIRQDGTQDAAGKFWKCGRLWPLTDAEIIAKADEVRARKLRRLAA